MIHLWMYRPHLENIPVYQLQEGYIVRPLMPDDNLADLATTLRLAFDYPWDVALVRKKLVDAVDVLATFVVCWESQIVATASSRYLAEQLPVSGYIHWVATHPDHARRGLASAMTTHLLNNFRERGYENACLETDDFRISAIRTYLKSGFIPVYNMKDEDHRLRWSNVFQSMYEKK